MPAFKFRGLMLDPAREMERHDTFEFLLPWLREWGYNLLHLHLTDDQGCALAFPSHPELATPGAFSPSEMKALIHKARRLGIQIVPEIESLGHTRFITRLPSYQKLGGDTTTGFNALDPDQSETRRILADLFQDASRIFESEIIHAGLDEVDFSKLPRYAGLSRAESGKVFARHAAWVHETIRASGKRPAMWGDHILMSREMATEFKRDVLIFDWHYDPDFNPESLNFFTTQGFEVWGAPSMLCWRARVLTNVENFTNLREFAAHALLQRSQGVTGLVNTVWCPWRYLTGAMDWPIALAGHLFSESRENPDFCRDYCASFYGLAPRSADRLAQLLGHLHALAPTSFFLNLLITGKGPTAPFNREHIRRCKLLADQVSQLIPPLAELVRKAPRNADRLHDVLLSARILERLGRFGEAGRSARRLPAGTPLIKSVFEAWNRTRIRPAPVAVKDPKEAWVDQILQVVKATR